MDNKKIKRIMLELNRRYIDEIMRDRLVVELFEELALYSATLQNTDTENERKDEKE